MLFGLTNELETFMSLMNGVFNLFKKEHAEHLHIVLVSRGNKNSMPNFEVWIWVNLGCVFRACGFQKKKGMMDPQNIKAVKSGSRQDL